MMQFIKHHRFGTFICFILALLCVQLAFLKNTTLPFTHTQNAYIGTKNVDVTANILKKSYEDKRIKITNDSGESLIFNLHDLGISVDTHSQARVLSNYQFNERIIPFSILRNAFYTPQLERIEINIDKMMSNTIFDEAKNASIEVDNSDLVIIDDNENVELSFDDLTLALNNLDVSKPVDGYYEISLPFKLHKPKVTTEYAQHLASKIKKNLSEGADFKVDESLHHADYATLLQWIHFDYDDENKINVRFDTDDFIKFASAQGLTKQNYDIDTTNTLAALSNLALADHLADADKVVDIKYLRQNGNWDALEQYLTTKYASQNVEISMIDFSGREDNLSINADRPFTAASTYKLFMALSMFKSGNVPSCIDDMIIYSDNACPEEFANNYSWYRVNEDARNVGAINTDLTSTPTQTTAHDLTHYLSLLDHGSLYPNDFQNRLLNLMKRQVFREGIPTGVGDDGVVADKVGFLNGVLNDAGIVYSNKGNYALAIMTDDFAWREIADISRRIQQAY